MIKQFLRTSSLLAFTLAILTTSSQAFAAGSITGTVYQITPTDVYVEMPDHTAVRVPNDSANFMMNGAPVDVTDLRRGNPIMVEYLPKTHTAQTTTYTSVDRVPGPPTGTVTTVRDTTTGGHTVHHVWSDGSWHVQQ